MNSTGVFLIKLLHKRPGVISEHVVNYLSEEDKDFFCCYMRLLSRIAFCLQGCTGISTTVFGRLHIVSLSEWQYYGDATVCNNNRPSAPLHHEAAQTSRDRINRQMLSNNKAHQLHTLLAKQLFQCDTGKKKNKYVSRYLVILFP